MDDMTSDPTTTTTDTFPEASIPDDVAPADVHQPADLADMDPRPIAPDKLLSALGGLNPIELLRNPSLIRGPVELLQSAAAVAVVWEDQPADLAVLVPALDRLAAAVKAMGL